ncbi:MAG TPA: DUF5985 family protein [Rhodanobacteraceae bacterium]|nr:DUF5985 family protein [Rhodanobacteraceae bacterium]
MASFVYGLVALTSLLCAVLLLRAYGRSRLRVLLWSGLCFCGLVVSNGVLILDKLVFPEIDLFPLRLWITLLSLLLLLFGLIYESE